MKLFKISATKLTLMLAAALIATGCSEQTETKVETISFTPMGPAFDRAYNVNQLFVNSGNAYLPISGRTDSPIRFAKLSIESGRSTAYKVTELLIPAGSNLKNIGNVYIEPTKEQLYSPVVAVEGGMYSYGWLQYDANSITPNRNIVGNYQVPANSAFEFAVGTPAFYQQTLYANYAGKIVGINTANGQQTFQKTGLLTPLQNNFFVIDKRIVTVASDKSGLVSVDMVTGEQKNTGDKFSALADKGYRVMPFLAIFEANAFVLANTPDNQLGLCSLTLTTANPAWACKKGNSQLSPGEVIKAFSADTRSGTLYFLTNNFTLGTQLYQINQP